MENKMFFTTVKKAVKDSGVAYLGGLKKSHKMELSFKAHTATYCLYLAPADLSGYNVCPCSKYCRENCLNGSGRNRMELLHASKCKLDYSRITRSRIAKTKLFFEQKEFFMAWLIHEIKRAQKYAIKNKMEFSVRLNGTSDISIEDFCLNGKNILEIFPNVQFYDYTKVKSRFSLLEKYKNYDLTFSYDGHNWKTCESLLNKGEKVAVVFFGNLPKTFHNFKVNDGNKYDMRYKDNGGEIVGLTYHKVANDYINGKFKKPNTQFVIYDDDPFYNI